MLNKIKILICLILMLQVKAVVGQTSFVIPTGDIYINGSSPVYQGVKPGDTLYFEGGNKDYLLIKNLRGAPGNPIVMINSGGPVIIDTDHYYGIAIQNCQFIKFTGTGDPGQMYGFQVKRVANGGGMGVGELSSDFEIDHVSIENTLIGGLYAKTDPDCSLTSVRGAFTQYNTIIHDNYIAYAGNEGMYIGSTKYDGQEVFCNGKDTVLMPSLLEGVKVYNNIVKYAGWDGIQVSSASKGCEIYNNTVLFDSQAEVTYQMSGIILGGGTRGDCYNNFISQGKGDGIECHGLGGCRIFNNIILDPGRSYLPADLTQMKHGIYVSDNSVEIDSSFYIQHNDIINPKSEGIRFSSTNSKNSLIASNVIINPGNFDLYENGNTRFKGIDSYIMFQDLATDAMLRNNYLSRTTDSVKFVSATLQAPDDLKLATGSPLIDKAETDAQIDFDFSGSPRPFGVKSEIGAFEFTGTTTGTVPGIKNVTGGGTFCEGDAGLPVGLGGSQEGVNYQLVMNGNNTGGVIAGTGSAISFGLQMAPGTYTVVATDAHSLLTEIMAGTATITVDSLPALYQVTGGGGYCYGETGKVVGLSGSQSGVNYQLFVNGTSTGSPLPGTGSAISFGVKSEDGIYTVVAKNGTTNCTVQMNGSVTVTVNPLPPVPAAIGGTTSLCAGSTTALTEATAGGVWSSRSPSIATVSSFGVVTGLTAGTATIQYTVTNGSGCSSSVTTVVTVNSPAGQPGKFTASTTRVKLGKSNVVYTVPYVTGVTYKWSYSGKGATITGTSNSVLVSFSLTATSGTLSVTANNSCGSSIPRSISITMLKGATIPDGTAEQASDASTDPLVELQTLNNELTVYPNPSFGQTNIDFQIGNNGRVTLEVLSMTGQYIARIFDADLEAGIRQTVNFQKTLPSGIYYCVMRWSGKMKTAKLIVKQ